MSSVLYKQVQFMALLYNIRAKLPANTLTLPVRDPSPQPFSYGTTLYASNPHDSRPSAETSTLPEITEITNLTAKAALSVRAGHRP
jgi:hypothetical protein